MPDDGAGQSRVGCACDVGAAMTSATTPFTSQPLLLARCLRDMLLRTLARETRTAVACSVTACCIIGCAPAARNTPEAPRDGAVRIPGGSFTMGTDSAAVPALLSRYGFASARIFADEVPGRRATVAPFTLDRTEVTRGAFREFLLARPE